MYDRAPRFRKLITATPENVGPTTYLLSDIFDQSVRCQCGPGTPAPFNSSSLRNITFTNRTLVENPSPSKYKICFRKQRIVGGTSMQNMAPRFMYRDKGRKGPDLTKDAKRLRGHIYRGVPPRSNATTVTTIPEKGAEGYLVTEEGLVKIYNPPQDRPIGPTSYYNPEGNDNYTTFQYKGNFWSLRSAQRFKYKTADGPSPAEYSIDQEDVSPWKKFQDMLQAKNQANALSLRYGDVVLRKLCRENLPGPGAYSPRDPNIAKCECGTDGTFSKAKRKELNEAIEGPGPAAYTDPRTAFDRATRTVSMKKSPFNVDAQRFPRTRYNSLPGPSDYDPKIGLWNELKKRGTSRYSQWTAPFDSSAYRNTSMTKPDVLCIPGPDMYYPQLQKKGDNKRSSMFASKMKRDSLIVNKNLPGPDIYSPMEPFKIISSRKDHFQPKDSAFLSSSERMTPLEWSDSPGPDTYETVQSSLNSKSGIIGMRFGEKAADMTPSPAHYKIHPKFATSGVLHTSNVTLMKQTKSKGEKRKQKPSWKKGQEIVKKLRCFSSARYPNKHCSIY